MNRVECMDEYLEGGPSLQQILHCLRHIIIHKAILILKHNQKYKKYVIFNIEYIEIAYQVMTASGFLL